MKPPYRTIATTLPIACALGLTLARVSPALATDIDCAGTTPIYEIQGKGHISPFVGQEVETCGVVTAVAFNGYYLQDPQGDGDEATSDALFVFQRGDLPATGTLMRVRDRVSEFVPGGATTGNLSITQLSFPQVLAQAPGAPLPPAVIIGSGGRVPPNERVISPAETDPPINLQQVADATVNPFNPNVDGIDFYESLEGMRVTVEDAVAVSAVRQFASFSAEVVVLANQGADIAPRTARTARGGINLQPDPDNRGDQNPERIQIQFDATLYGSSEFPSIKVGDRLGDVTGVVGYSFGNFEVNALAPVNIDPSAIEEEQVRNRGSSRLSLVSYNTLNLSAVDGDTPQRNKIARQVVENLASPDILALQEIQDNNGDVNDCPPGDSSACAGVLDAGLTLQRLVDAVVAAGGPRYAFFTVDPLQETTQSAADGPDVFGGVPLGNIRNAFLYNPRRVELVDYVGLDRDELERRGVSVPRAFDYSRDPLAATFSFRDQRLVVINNHFSSRFGSSPIFGALQPFVQAGEAQREAQAQAMHEVARALLAAPDTANVVVLGDLNTFEFTDDLTRILPGNGNEQILRNLVGKSRDDNNYSFIFEGNSQVLDHIFVSNNLYGKARFDFVHVNVDFPRLRGDTVASDHEPVRALLKLDDSDDEDEADNDDGA